MFGLCTLRAYIPVRAHASLHLIAAISVLLFIANDFQFFRDIKALPLVIQYWVLVRVIQVLAGRRQHKNTRKLLYMLTITVFGRLNTVLLACTNSVLLIHIWSFGMPTFYLNLNSTILITNYCPPLYCILILQYTHILVYIHVYMYI